MRVVTRLASIAIVSVGLSVAGACSNANNNTGDRVEKALENANVKHVNVDYDKNANVVHLKGKVDSRTERERAEQVATGAVGTSGKVLNELTVDGMNADRLDDVDSRIKDRLNAAVTTDKTLADQSVDFRVNNGVVTVTGEVNSAAEKERVSRLVQAVPGVKDMANELSIKGTEKVGVKGTTGRKDRPKR